MAYTPRLARGLKGIASAMARYAAFALSSVAAGKLIRVVVNRESFLSHVR